ncbi:MAG TPA: rhodanese-like domain-containing protein [Candidatus Limnocylindrales bacterium]|nr:rhodanese-like domain-containing protein [Candidatus Limnocylindrales bacterium]
MFSFLKKLGTSTPSIDIVELESRMAAGEVRLIDVREESEFRRGHVPGAVNIPKGRLAGRVATLKRDRPYAVICASGSRSIGATDLLLAEGFEGAVSVRGGTSAWARSGRAVVR